MWRHELHNFGCQLMPHDRRFAYQALNLLGADMTAWAHRLNASCGGHHALQQPTNIFAHRRVDSLVLLNILQLHLLQKNVEHQDATCQVVFRVGRELLLRSGRGCLVIVGNRRVRDGFVFDHRRWWGKNVEQTSKSCKNFTYRSSFALAVPADLEDLFPSGSACPLCSPCRAELRAS